MTQLVLVQRQGTSDETIFGQILDFFMQIYSFLENTINELSHISLIHMKFVASTLYFGSPNFSTYLGTNQSNHIWL